MKKVLILSTLTILLCLSFGLTKASANSCGITCKFSKCSINCPDPCTVACGCYFGIACCNSELVKATPTIHTGAIDDFGRYAVSIGNNELISLSYTLKTLKADNTYNTVLERYKLQVASMSAESQKLLDEYLAK